MACANQNAPHTNNSQFFITMDRCDHLDRKNTIFGKVTGESIYNAMHLNEQEVGSDTPHTVSAMYKSYLPGSHSKNQMGHWVTECPRSMCEIANESVRARLSRYNPFTAYVGDCFRHASSLLSHAIVVAAVA